MDGEGKWPTRLWRRGHVLLSHVGDWTCRLHVGLASAAQLSPFQARIRPELEPWWRAGTEGKKDVKKQGSRTVTARCRQAVSRYIMPHLPSKLL